MNNYPDQTRTLNPTLKARVAMIIYGEEYSKQSGGSMDFWDGLSPDKQRRCVMVIDLVKSRVANNNEVSNPPRAGISKEGEQNG